MKKMFKFSAKKVLALSTLGCVATIGAVFAAFTMDPTTESDDIENTNIDVDFSSEVFSDFTHIVGEEDTDVFEYNGGASRVYDNIPVHKSGDNNGAPYYTFQETHDANPTLDLKCSTKYTMDDWLEYLAWRDDPQNAEPEDHTSDEWKQWMVKNRAVAPYGHIFTYTYDQKFLDRIDAEEDKPSLPEWQYHIYKTCFSSALTKSDFTASDLAEYNVVYTDPSDVNPNYSEFNWIKNPEDPQSWVDGCDGFLIIPNRDQTGTPQDNGIIIFSGQDMTENLFSTPVGQVFDVDGCEDYLNEVSEGEYIHRNFSVRLKATEYVPPVELSLDFRPSMFIHTCNAGDAQLEEGKRYSFNFVFTSQGGAIGENPMFYINSGYNMGRFCITDGSVDDVIPLLATGEQESALELKVIVTNKNGAVTNITNQFKYGNNVSDPTNYGSIYFDTSIGTYIPQADDTVTIEFTFRKSSTNSTNGKVKWSRAGMELAKNVTQTYTLVDDDKQYALDLGSPITVNQNEIYRFKTPILTKQFLGLFEVASSGAPVTQLSERTRIYLYDQNNHLVPLKESEDYQFTDTGIQFNAQTIFTKYDIQDDDKYGIAIDFLDKSTSGNPFDIQTATFSYEAAPIVYEFGDYTRDTAGDVLSSGSFVTDNTLEEEERTLHKGDNLSFRADLTSKDFQETIEELSEETTTVNTVNMRYVIVDNQSKEISGIATFKVLRNGTIVVPVDDTNEYMLGDQEHPGTIQLKSGQELEYIKSINMGYKKGATVLNFNYTYDGANDIVFDNAHLYLDITK